MIRTRQLALTVVVFLCSVSCAKDDWGPDVLAYGHSPGDAAKLRRGREAYETYCAGCHGAQGDGEGPAARFLEPKPRDLRKARVKFAAVPSGSMPRDEDLLRTITNGLEGTSMPSWRLLPKDDQLAIVAYVRTFSEAWQKERPAAPVAIKDDPFKRNPDAALELGERVYHGIAACSSCHPAYATKPKIVAAMKSFDVPFSSFRDDMYASVVKNSDWGAPIKPPDFLVDKVKSGATRDDLVRVIAAGVGGTAMPSWAGMLPNDQIWSLAYYVESLAALRGTPEARELAKSLAEQPPFPEGPR